MPVLERPPDPRKHAAGQMTPRPRPQPEPHHRRVSARACGLSQWAAVWPSRRRTIGRHPLGQCDSREIMTTRRRSGSPSTGSCHGSPVGVRYVPDAPSASLTAPINRGR